VILGDLGACQAPEEAYTEAARIARRLLDGKLPAGLDKLRAGLADDIKKNVLAISPTAYRVGGGRLEPDGSASFVFRFIGNGKNCAGEIYLEKDAKGAWLLDDLQFVDEKDIQAAQQQDASQSDSQSTGTEPFQRFY
jgi:hypothetical protein